MGAPVAVTFPSTSSLISPSEHHSLCYRPPRISTPRQYDKSKQLSKLWTSSATNTNATVTTAATASSTASSSLEAFGVTETGKFTISDETLTSRGFKLHSTLQGIDLDQLNSLFVKVGFPRRQKVKLEKALENTSSLTWLQEEKSGNLIAFARATGDDVFNAIIWDVVVDPSYQGLGLGKAIMERLMVDLLGKGITNICLYAEPNVVGFYKPLGYIPDPQGIKAMAYSRRDKK